MKNSFYDTASLFSTAARRDSVTSTTTFLGEMLGTSMRTTPSAYKEKDASILLSFAPYRIMFRIELAQVHGVAVYDERRDLEDLLLRRLLRD